MLSVPLWCLLLAGEAVAHLPAAADQPRDLQARQTGAFPSECVSAWEPLESSRPEIPEELIDFWTDNDPLEEGCVARPPDSLTSAYGQMTSDYVSWWSEKSDSISSYVSECFGDFISNQDGDDNDDGGNGQKLKKRTTPASASASATETLSISIPTHLSDISLPGIPIPTSIPEEWSSYISMFTAMSLCSETSDSATSSVVPSSAVSSSEPSASSGAVDQCVDDDDDDDECEDEDEPPQGTGLQNLPHLFSVVAVATMAGIAAFISI